MLDAMRNSSYNTAVRGFFLWMGVIIMSSTVTTVSQRDIVEIQVLRTQIAQKRAELRTLRKELKEREEDVKSALLSGVSVEDGLHAASLEHRMILKIT